jgi:hypothetical protein
MKNHQLCPKCGSKEVVCIPGRCGLFGIGNDIPHGGFGIPVSRYLCTECGFLEEWVEKPLELRQLRMKYGGSHGETG